MKKVIGPLVKLLDYIFFRVYVDTSAPNHAVGVYEEMEEDWVRIWFAQLHWLALVNKDKVGEDPVWNKATVKYDQ